MDEDGIELAGYYGERHRADGPSLGETLVDLYARRRTAASVVLRGADGFAAGRSGADRSPPAPWEPQLAVTAVDSRGKAEALLDEAVRLAGDHLFTLERVRLLSGDIEVPRLGEHPGEATRLTLYCARQDRVYQLPAFEAACELLYRRGIAGATVLPGIDGSHLGRRQRAQFLRHGADVPLVITAVGAGRRIAMLLPELGGLFRHPLMTVASVSLCKRDGEFVSRPQLAADAAGPAGPAGPEMTAMVKLTVYTSEATRFDGQPLHRLIVHRLRSADFLGAISVRGIWGFHLDHAPHGDHFPHLGHHVPVVTTVIDTAERISAAFDVIDALTRDRGLVTAETVLTSWPAPVPHER